MSIPLFVVEEHNEVVQAWRYFAGKKIVSSHGNTLVHIDHHDDLQGGMYGFSMSEKSVYHLSDKSLNYGIADFILPFVYCGFLSKVVWIGNFDRNYEEKRRLLCFGERFLRVAKERQSCVEINGFLTGWTDFEYCETNIEKCESNDDENFILDIDLDYFCWNKFPYLQGVYNEIEITEDAYDKFNNDPYHFLKLHCKSRYSTSKRGNRFFLVERDLDECFKEYSKTYSEENIYRRLDAFYNWLLSNPIRPKGIDLCKSVLSGYCPSSVIPWLQDEVMNRLKEVYDVEIHK